MLFIYVLVVVGVLAALAGFCFYSWGGHSIGKAWRLEAGPAIAVNLRRRHKRLLIALLGAIGIILGLELVWPGFYEFVAGMLDRLAGLFLFRRDPLEKGPTSAIFFSLLLVAVLAGMWVGSWRACRSTKFPRMKCVRFIDLILRWRH
jgi:hypothetical protein